MFWLTTVQLNSLLPAPNQMLPSIFLTGSFPSPHYLEVHARALPRKMVANSATTVIQSMLKIKHWAIVWQCVSFGPILQFIIKYIIYMSTFLLNTFSASPLLTSISPLPFWVLSSVIFLYFTALFSDWLETWFIPSLPCINSHTMW